MYPWQRAKYHPDWEKLSQECIEAANNKCEECGSIGRTWRLKKKYAVHEAQLFLPLIETLPINQEAEQKKMCKVVLNAAHLEHDPWNPNPHLRALCQACHLLYDRMENGRNAWATKQRRYIETICNAGQLPLRWENAS